MLEFRLSDAIDRNYNINVESIHRTGMILTEAI